MLLKKFALILLVIFTILACEEDKIIVPHQNESINKIVLNCTSLDSTESITIEYPLSKEITPPKLRANTTYTTRLRTYNVLADTIHDVTQQIELKKEANQFFYTPKSTSISIEYKDVDANEQPVGLETTLITTSATQTQIEIQLIHHPVKSVDNNTISNPAAVGGTTDFKFNLDLTVE